MYYKSTWADGHYRYDRKGKNNQKRQKHRIGEGTENGCDVTSAVYTPRSMYQFFPGQDNDDTTNPQKKKNNNNK